MKILFSAGKENIFAKAHGHDYLASPSLFGALYANFLMNSHLNANGFYLSTTHFAMPIPLNFVQKTEYNY